MDQSKMEGLALAVEAIDAASPEAQQQRAEEEAQVAQAAATAVSEADAWAAVPAMVGKLVCMVAPELQPIYAAENCREWGESMVPVAQKYGWNGPGALPELNLAIATAGIAVPTFMVMRVKLAQLRAAAKPAELPASNAAASASPADASAVGGPPPEGGS